MLRLLPPALLLVAAFLSGCEREDRPFRVDAPSAGRTALAPLSDLRPGPPSRPTHMANEYEENAYSMNEGKRLFEQFNCVGCHAHGGGGMGPPLMDSLWVYGGAPEQVFATIVEGRPNGMPSFRGRIADYQVWQLVAYVRSMSGLVPFDAATNRSDDLYPGPPENSRELGHGPRPSSLPPSTQMPQ